MEAFFKEILEGPTVDVFSTRVGQLVKRGVDEGLPGPDWGINMEIVDQISAGGKEACADCVKAVSAVVKQKGENPKAVYLALIILETTMKNIANVAPHVNATFMLEMVSLAKGIKGKKNADEAARLIQQWGRAFEKERSRMPHFFDTYVALRAKGVAFPSEEDPEASHHTAAFHFSDAYEEFPSVGGGSTGRTLTASQSENSNADGHFVLPDPNSNPCPAASQLSITNASEFERLERDLSTIEDKVKLCQEMLVESPGLLAGDELLAEIVGFLEACRDRLAEVIEAGTQGVLSEVAVGRCLKVHDAVLRTLEQEKSSEGRAGEAKAEEGETKQD